MKKFLYSLMCLLSFMSFSQDRIEGFLEDRFIEDQTYKVKTQLEKLTDVYIAFALPDATTNDLKWRYSIANLKKFSAYAKSKGVRVHASIGGAAQGSTGWTTIISTSAKRKAFAANIANQIQNLRLDGVNLDWEFPAGSYANNYELLAIEIRKKLDEYEVTLGRPLELSAAVAPLQWNNAGISSTFISKMDYIHIMAFDDGSCGPCGGPNHSSLTHATNAVNYWINTKGVDPAQVVLAIPFYSNTKVHYKDFSASNPAAYFNDADGSYGGQYYNSKPLILDKINMVATKGGSGVFIWEVTQDRTDQYSLLSAIHDELGGNLGCPKPKLPGSIELCDKTTETLNGAVSEPGTTYKWYLNNQIISGETSGTLTVDKAGTYKIVRTISGCTDEEASTTVTSDLLEVDDALGCPGQKVKLKVNNPSGTISWYSSISSTSALGTGTEFEFDFTGEVTYYVESKSDVVNTCVGTPNWEAKQYGSTVTEVVYQGVKYRNAWWAGASDVPGTAGGPWKVVEDCGGVAPPSCARVPVFVGKDVCAAIQNASNNQQLEIYPNPSDSEVHVSLKDGKVIESVQLVSVNGELIKESIIQDNNGVLSLTSVEPGLYILKITTGEVSYIQKIVKK